VYCYVYRSGFSSFPSNEVIEDFPYLVCPNMVVCVYKDFHLIVGVEMNITVCLTTSYDE
jgi:hypothetical protein